MDELDWLRSTALRLLPGATPAEVTLREILAQPDWYGTAELAARHVDFLRDEGIALLRNRMGSVGTHGNYFRAQLRFLEAGLAMGFDQVLEAFIGPAGVSAGRARQDAQEFRAHLDDRAFESACSNFMDALSFPHGTVPENPANAVQGLGALLSDGANHYGSGILHTLAIRCLQVTVALRLPAVLMVHEQREMFSDGEADIVVAAFHRALEGLCEMVEVEGDDLVSTVHGRLGGCYATLRELPAAEFTVEQLQACLLAVAAALSPVQEVDYLLRAGGADGGPAHDGAVVETILAGALPGIVDRYLGTHVHLLTDMLQGVFALVPDEVDTTDTAARDVVRARLHQAVARLDQWTPSDPPYELLCLAASAAMDMELAGDADDDLVAETENALEQSLQRLGDAPVPLFHPVERARDGLVRPTALRVLLAAGRGMRLYAQGRDAELVMLGRDLTSSPEYEALVVCLTTECEETRLARGEPESTARRAITETLLRFESMLVFSAGDLGLTQLVRHSVSGLVTHSGLAHVTAMHAEHARMWGIESGLPDEVLRTTAAVVESDFAVGDPERVAAAINRALAVNPTPRSWRALAGVLGGLAIAVQADDPQLALTAHLRCHSIAAAFGSETDVATACTNISAVCVALVSRLDPGDLDQGMHSLSYRLLGMNAVREGFRNVQAVASRLPLDLAVTVVDNGFAALGLCTARLVAGFGDGTLLAQALAYQHSTTLPGPSSGTGSPLRRAVHESHTGSWLTERSPYLTRSAVWGEAEPPSPVAAVEDALRDFAGSRPYVWFALTEDAQDDEEAGEVYAVCSGPGLETRSCHTAMVRGRDQAHAEVPEEVESMLREAMVAVLESDPHSRPLVVCTVDGRSSLPAVAAWRGGQDGGLRALGEFADVVYWPGQVHRSVPTRPSQGEGGVWAVLDPLGDLRHARGLPDGAVQVLGGQEARPATRASVLEALRNCALAGGDFVYQGHFLGNNWGDLSGGGLVLDPGEEILRGFRVLTARDLLESLEEIGAAPRSVCLFGCGSAGSSSRSWYAAWPTFLLSTGVEFVIASSAPLVDTRWLAEQAIRLAGLARAEDPIAAFSRWQAEQSYRDLGDEDRFNLGAMLCLTGVGWGWSE